MRIELALLIRSGGRIWFAGFLSSLLIFWTRRERHNKWVIITEPRASHSHGHVTVASPVPVMGLLAYS